VGWQTTWATEGQLAVVLERTGILAEEGFDPTFVGFTYGGPLNEGALAGEVDVLFTADQPAVSLLARAPDMGIISRLMYNRVGTFVPPDSPVHAPADLRGRTVAIPFGAAAHRETLRAIEAAGLDAARDVRTVNLGVQELVALVGAGATDGRWGEVDAGSAWDPAFADLEHGGRVRTVAQAVVTAVAVMDMDYVAAHPGADGRFLTALERAWAWYRDHREQADAWFLEEAKLSFDPEVLAVAASVEPNLDLDQPVRVALDASDLARLQEAADFMAKADLLPESLQVASRVHQPAR
jgi:sulfonate transport system substrate-binding protein